MSEAEAEKPRESRYLEAKKRRRKEIGGSIQKRILEARNPNESDKYNPTQKAYFNSEELEKEIERDRIEISVPQEPSLKGWEKTVVPTAEEQMKDDFELKKILQAKKEAGRVGFPMLRAMCKKVKQLENIVVEKIKRKEEPSLTKEEYRTIPHIDAVCTDNIEDVADRLNILEDEFKTLKTLRIEPETLETLLGLKLVTEDESQNYLHTQYRIYQTIEHKLNPKEMPDLKTDLIYGAGALGTIFGVCTLLGALATSIPTGIAVVVTGGMALFGVLVGIGAGYTENAEESTKIKDLDSRNLNQEYSRLTDALNPLKEIVEGKRKVEDLEERPHAARIADKMIGRIKYKVEQLYKLAGN